jgi:DNA-binding CsgD family transcriptional regulator
MFSMDLGKQILLLLQQGKTIKEIGEILSLPRMTIHRYKKKYQELTNIDMSVEYNKHLLAYKLYVAGMPIKDIARFLNYKRYNNVFLIIQKYKKSKIKIDVKVHQIGILE